MKIKMLVGLAGNEYSLAPGDERDFPQEEAARLIGAGYAVPVAARPIETTSAPPVRETREIADVASAKRGSRAERRAGNGR